MGFNSISLNSQIIFLSVLLETKQNAQFVFAIAVNMNALKLLTGVFAIAVNMNALKLLTGVFGCRWLGWKWIAT